MANKTDLVNAVQGLVEEVLVEKEVSINKKEATAIVDAVIDSIIGLTGESGKLQLVGFGTFSVKERAEREGRNPSTGEPLTIAASKSVGFKAGKAFKDFVKQ